MQSCIVSAIRTATECLTISCLLKRVHLQVAESSGTITLGTKPQQTCPVWKLRKAKSVHLAGNRCADNRGCLHTSTFWQQNKLQYLFRRLLIVSYSFAALTAHTVWDSSHIANFSMIPCYQCESPLKWWSGVRFMWTADLNEIVLNRGSKPLMTYDFVKLSLCSLRWQARLTHCRQRDNCVISFLLTCLPCSFEPLQYIWGKWTPMLFCVVAL